MNLLNKLLSLKKRSFTVDYLHSAKKLPHPALTDVFLFFLCTLCGRATLFDLLRPFGGAFFTAVFSGRYSYIYIIAALLGQVSSGAPLYECGKYMFAMTLAAVIRELSSPSSKSSHVMQGWTYAFSLSVSGLCFMFTSTQGFARTTIYDILLLFTECCAGFCAAAAFSAAIPIIKRMNLSYSFSPLEEISLVSLLGCSLWGAKEICQIGPVNLANIICILIVLIFSIRLGASRGVIAGLTMGLVSALGSGEVDAGCVSYAFSALAASLVGELGAIPGCSAFILANALVTALANSSTQVLINIYDIFAACILYALIPEKVLLRVTSFGSRDEIDRTSREERAYSAEIIQRTENIVSLLGKRVTLLQDSRLVKGESEKRFFERLARKSCMDCGMRRLCWGKDIRNTQKSLKKALLHHMESGSFDFNMLPQGCVRQRDLKEALLSSGEIYRVETMWQGKLKEMQETSKNQISAFLKILSAAASSVAEPHVFDPALADDILRKLDLSGIKCSEVIAMRDWESDPIVMVSLKSCGGFCLCEKGAAEIVSEACGTKMIPAGKRDCTSCNIRYVPAAFSKADFAVSFKSRDKRSVSGDSVNYRVINKNLFAAVLCDGMGFGEKAAMEAKGAADTLLDLMEGGISGEDAMEIVNSLFIPYGEATFSAADLCIYDASKNSAKIIKCGSAASFTKSGGRVDALYSKNMPLGSLVKNPVETYNLSASSGDIIVMVSDGVLENNKENALRDAWLIDELENFTDGGAKDLADTILNKAMIRCNMTPRDDITVLAAKIL